MPEIRIPFSEIDTPEKATSGTKAAFIRRGLSIHRHEVDALEDDPKKRERILQVREAKKYIFLGKNS